MKRKTLRWIYNQNYKLSFKVQQLIGSKASYRMEYPSGEYSFSKFYRKVDSKEKIEIKETHQMPYNDMVDRVNQRQVMPFEIVFDIDGKSKEHALEVAADVSGKLAVLGFDNTIWDTGNKGYHVHCFMTELLNYPPYEREQIREFFYDLMEHKEIDRQLKSENVMVLLEHAPHRKTRNAKVPVHSTSKEQVVQEKLSTIMLVNNTKLPKTIIQRLNDNKVKEVIIKTNAGYYDDYNKKCIQYYLDNTKVIPNGYRDKVLFSLLSNLPNDYDNLKSNTVSFNNRHSNFLTDRQIEAKVNNAIYSKRTTGCRYNKAILKELGIQELCEVCKWRDSNGISE